MAQGAWVSMVAAVLAALAGCGGSGSGSGDVSLQELPARAVDVFCQAELACGLFPDSASCHSALQADQGQVEADVAAGKVKYDGAQAAACLDALPASVSCTQSAPRRPQPSACNQIFVGTVAMGGPCLANEDCVSASCDFKACATATMCCAGTCATPQPSSVAVGGACNSINQCAVGAYCNFDVTPFVCAPVKAAGQPCSSSNECMDGAACLPTSASSLSMRACGRPPRRGEACPGPTSCDSRADFCDPLTMKCVARLAPGAACMPAAMGCVAWAFCDTTSLKCVARGGVGEPCDATNGGTCLSDLTCAGGVCALRPLKPVCPQP
jgi:hypothetical protein